MPMNAASVVPAWDPIMPPVLAATANRAPATWRGPASSRSWATSSTTWAMPVAPSGWPRLTRPPLVLTVTPGAPEGGVAGRGGGPGVAGLVEPERLEGADLLGAGGVVQLDHVDVGRVDARGVPGRGGRLGQAVVVVDLAVARPDRARQDPRRPGRASRVSTTAAAPSVNDEHISRVSGGTMAGEASTSSRVTSLWNWAWGLRAPCLRALTAAAPICSTVVPHASMCSTVHLALRAMSTEPDGFSQLACMKCAVDLGHPVLDAGQGLHAVPGPHLLDADGQHGAGPAERGQGGQVQGRGPAGARVVDVDDPGVAQPGVEQEALAPDAGLVEEPAGGGVPEDDQVDLVGGQPGVGQGVVDDLVGHGLDGEVAPLHGGGGGADDVCGAVHGSSVSAVQRSVGTPAAGRAAIRRANWSMGRSSVT